MHGPRIGLVLLGLCALTLPTGCGSENPLGRKAIYGKVTLNGKPLDVGGIEFHPLVEGGVPSGGPITGGSYSIPESQGLPVGTYRVAIYDNPPAPPLPPGHIPGDDLPPQPKPQVPAQWNSKSEHTIEVKKAGPVEFNFEIGTKKT